MRKLLILVIAVLVIVLGYNYIYKDHRDISSEKAEFTLSSSELSSEFSLNSVQSEEKFLNKTVEVKGAVTEISDNSLTLDESVYCQFDDAITLNIEKNTMLKIKGRIIGFDDLLQQVKLDQCSILN